MEGVHENNHSFLGYDINNLELIGEGRQGKVYRLPDSKVLKVFHSKKSYKDQLNILLKGKDSRFFPTVFKYDTGSIIMEFLEGIPLSEYLLKNPLDEQLSIELVKLIEEFNKLYFTRLDIRLRHIYVQAGKTIKIIDPRKSFEIVQPYPLLMMRGLENHGFLEVFLNYIKVPYPEHYAFWKSNM
jgi:hypothetical protein